MWDLQDEGASVRILDELQQTSKSDPRDLADLIS
jgi:hypothetical protein